MAEIKKKAEKREKKRIKREKKLQGDNGDTPAVKSNGEAEVCYEAS